MRFVNANKLWLVIFKVDLLVWRGLYLTHRTRAAQHWRIWLRGDSLLRTGTFLSRQMSSCWSSSLSRQAEEMHAVNVILNIKIVSLKSIKTEV